LGRTSDIDVVGEAADGVSAIRQANALKPDAVVMDLDLPEVDGFEATAEIYRQRPIPVIVVTSKLEGRDEILQTFGTVRSGVVDILAKPRTPDQWDALGRNLVETVRHLGASRFLESSASTSPVHAVQPRPWKRKIRYLVIGASTGGPGALCELLRAIGRPLPFAVLIVQHISEGFDSGLAEWLSHELGIDVALAQKADRLTTGSVRIAPANSLIRVDRNGRIQIAPVDRHQFGASIDELFLSLVEWRPTEIAAILLSGMGRDGASGLLTLRNRGALTMVQDQASCAVFGMPRAALDEGAAELVMSPAAMGAYLRQIDRGS
jgi:two-component system chemotaxis response regulator CheB